LTSWMQDESLLETFRSEVGERIASLQSGLLQLEETPDSPDVMNAIFRDAHTIKGSAKMMGFEAIKELAHRMEDVLGDVKDGRLALGPALADILLQSSDQIMRLLESLDRPDEIPDATKALMDALDQARVRAGSARQPKEPRPEEPEAVEKKKEPEGESAPVTETLGAARAASKLSVKATESESGAAVVGRPKPSEDELQAATGAPAATASEHTGASARTETFVNPIGQSIRIEASKVYELIDQAGEAVIGEIRLEELSRRLSEFMRDLEARMRRFRHKQDAQAFSDALEDVRQKIGSISAQLMETVLSQSRGLDRLQEQAMGLAMLPTASIFAPFPRLVRNLSRELGKEVELEMDGGGTELDKQVLEQIVDPIRHLLINAVDHGIERPDERVRKGKPRKGTLRVAARQRGRQVVIEVSDDGKGIDPKAVRETALKKGLIVEADELSESESLSLLFRPGFSTAGWITDTSGRGVGLDVVKEAVDRLKGTVEVFSTVNKGTTFSITLPITLAIVDVLLVDVGGQDFAVPVAAVDEVLPPEEQDVKEVAGSPCVIWRGHSVALFELHSILGVPTYAPEVPSGFETESPNGDGSSRGPALIVTSGTRRIAARVDALIGQQEVVIKGLGSFLPRIRHIAGASILGDGRVALVLDPNELIDTARRPGGVPAAAARRRRLAAKPEIAPRRRILVVDDSLAIREMLRSIFEAAGYDVEIAADGRDALGIIQSSKIDGVVTDVEMPHMDGFALCEAIRSRPEIGDIPVVMVTGLEKEEDKRRGLEVGANAYIVKSTFDQSHLLDAVRSLVGTA
jgi:chemotaxis protein histidine kinase CheA